MDPLRRPLLTVLLVAGIVRAFALWIGWDSLRDDPDAYVVISQTLAKTGIFGIGGADAVPMATAFRPPLYPAILAVLSLGSIAVSGVFEEPQGIENSTWFRGSVAWLHWGLGLITAAATYWTARRLLNRSSESGNEVRTVLTAWFAAMLVIIDPILLHSSTRVMTETLATALAAMALLVWSSVIAQIAVPWKERGTSPQAETPRQCRRGCGWLPTLLTFAVLLGLAYLCRPTFIVWTLLLVAYLLIWAMRATRLDPLYAAIPLVLVTTILVGSWTLRNQRHFGHPIWATTHGGYTLLLGNNPPFYRYLRSAPVGIAWDPEDFFQRWQLRTQADPRNPDFWEPEAVVSPEARWQEQRPAAGDEVDQDRLAYETAMQSIRRDRSGFVRACFWRVGRLLSPMPQREGGPLGWGIIAVTAFYTGVLLLVLLGAVKLGRCLLSPPWAAALTLVLALTAVHAFYWTNMRMRAPAIPALAIVAAAALQRRPE